MRWAKRADNCSVNDWEEAFINMENGPGVLARQAVTQPVTRPGDEFDVVAFEADLLVQFAEQRVVGQLVMPDPALRELPATAIATSAQKQGAVCPHQHDADVGAEALAVDVVAHVLPARVRLKFVRC